MERYLREIQRGGSERSIISVQTVDSLSTEDCAIWRAIRKDLESIGITAAAYEANYDFIRDWLIVYLTEVPWTSRLYQVTRKTKPSSRSRQPATPSWGLVVLKPEEDHDRIGLEPSPPGKSPALISPLGKASDPERETRKAEFRGHVLKISLTAISRFFQMYEGISTPNDRLLFLVYSHPEDNSQIARILQKPAKRRKVDAETIKEVFSTATFRGYSDTVIELPTDGQPVDNVIYPREGASALMLAALGGATAMIHLLLRWGADVNFEGSHPPDVQKRDSYRFPVMLIPLGCGCAARQGHPEELVRMNEAVLLNDVRAH